MRARHRHFTLGNSGASACWDSRPLTQADATVFSSWADRVSGLTASASGAARPSVRTAVQGGQSIVRFASGNAMSVGSNSLTRNKSTVTIIGVAASTAATGTWYRCIGNSQMSGTATRCALYLTSSAAEAGGRRIATDSYQFVRSGSVSNNTFTIVGGLFNYGSAALTAYERGTAVSRSGGFQTAGNSANTDSLAVIGAFGGDGGIEPLAGDVGLFAFIETSSASLRRRFEHAAAYSFKIACN